MRIMLLALVWLAACSPAASSWDPMAVEPQQPKLPERLDPNDPHALYSYGTTILESSPARAAEVFYLAGRLDPTWADPLYARRVALLMVDPAIFSEYMRGTRRIVRSPGVQKVDSLYRHARMLSPFLQQKHDVKAIKRALAWSLEKELRRENPTAQVNRTEIEYYIDQMLQRVDPAVSAWIAHSEGRFVAAQESYRKALSQSNNKAYLRADLARLLVLMGRFPDARDEMTLALEELRATDQEKLIRVYESKALYEHSIGLILEQLGDQAGAREAYARALQEDLSYYPSHIRLGDLALSAGDTTTALTELELAVQIRGEDAGIRYMHAELLFRAGHFEAAAAESMEAIALEPLFALPYLLLAESIYAQGRHMDAAPHYREFLDRATRRAPEREQVKLRLAEIAANVSQEGSK